MELLAAHFVRAARTRFRCAEKSLDPASVPLLGAYSWPGNIRELENLIHRELLLSDGPMVTLRSLERLGGGDRAAPAKLTDARFQAAKARAIADFERAYIAELLSRTGGNISQAARLCGKERSRLGKLAKKYGIAHRSLPSEP